MIVVAGAGPAGLAAALVAARGGHEVTVVEAADTVGGMTGSYVVAGQSVDHGSHRLHPAMSAQVAAMLSPLVGSDLQRRERSGRVRIAGRWLGFPLRTVDLFRRLPAAVVGRMGLDALAAPTRRMRDDTYGEFVRAGLGPTVLREFYEPYAHKLWGRPVDELAGEIARRRITTSNPRAMVRRLATTRSSEGRSFLYPRAGFGQIADRLAEAAVDAGVELRLGCPVTGVRTTSTHVEVEAGASCVRGSTLLSTLPLGALLVSLGVSPPPIEHRGLLLAHLVVERSQWTRFDAHYVPALDVVASRISEPKNYRTSSDDPDGTTVLCAEIPTSPGDPWWDATRDAVTGRLVEDLDRLGLPVPVVSETVLRRIDRVYPVWGPGDDPLGRAEARLDQHPSVVSFGRGGRINADNTHHAIDMGIAAATCLDRSGSIDIAAWRGRRRRFAEHVVED